nr:collagen alpha-1(I) chain-like [Loxodonta africana]
MWQCGGDGREGTWSYPAELGSKGIGHKNAEKSNCDGDNTWQPPIFPSHGPSGFPTFPPPPLLINTRGCDPPAGACPDLCLGPVPTRGLLLLLPRAFHPCTTPPSPRRSKRRGRRLLARLPGICTPSFPSGARRGQRRPHLQLRPSRGDLCVSGDFLPLPPPPPHGDFGLPWRPKRQQAPGASAAGGASREGARQTPPTHPPQARKCLGDPGTALDPRDHRHTETSAPHLTLSTSSPACAFRPPPGTRPGPPSREPSSPSPPGVSPTAGESPARWPAANSPPSAGAESPGKAGREGKAAPLTPAATGCRSGSPRPAEPRRLRGAGLRRRRLPALAEGPGPPGGAGSPSRVTKPPGQHGSRAAEPRGRPTDPLGEAGAGAKRPQRHHSGLRWPGQTRAASPWAPGPDGGEPRRPRAAASLAARASETEKRLLLKCSNQRRRRKASRPPKLSPPPPALLAGGSATPAGGGGGGGAGEPGAEPGAGRGRAGYPRETPPP